jgi:hypothetical protein
MTEKSFYQLFMEKAADVKDYSEISIDGYPTIYMKNPDVRDIKESGILKGKSDDIELYIVDYMIGKLFAKEEDGTVGKPVFTAGARDALMKRWSNIHSEVLTAFTKFVTGAVDEEKKS